MKQKKRGFTLIEVTIFLALSGLLLAGVIATLGTSISSQRFYDATQNFADFLRSVYSGVANPQSIEAVGSGDNYLYGGGRSNYAIYGKLVVFGQDKDIAGNSIPENSEQKIYVYDVVGDASGTFGSINVVSGLEGANANVLVGACSTNAAGTTRCTDITLAGLAEEYIMKWGTVVEATENNAQGFKGSILIVRHPSSGTINTLFSNNVISVNATLAEARIRLAADPTGIEMLNPLSPYLEEGSSDVFTRSEINFCINRDGGIASSSSRQNVRILKGAHNATDVEVLDLDGANNVCNTSS